MRRLPVFFLVDVSESMIGENLYKLEEGIGAIASTLRTDPYALETAFVSVIAFAGKPITVCPLTELFAFHPPELPVGGGTALGAALIHLMDEIDRSVITTTMTQKGDWRPICFLLTDGHPTDNVSRALERWNASYRQRVNLVAVSIGGGADHAVLKRLTDAVIVFDDTAPDAFARFINWISMSIQSETRSVSTGVQGKVNLSKAEPGLLAPIEAAEGFTPFAGVDDRYAVFIAKCSKKKLPYVVKYERHMGRIQTSDPVLSRMLQDRRYVLDSAFPVKNSYFDLSEGTKSGQSVSSMDLIGQPSCPHCNASFAVAVCSCGHVHCLEGDGPQICPWCGNSGMYGADATGEGFDIGRGRG